MATDDATIMGGESALYVEWDIAEICGIEINAYIENEHLLTRELVEINFKKIVRHVKNDYIAHQVLGYIVLKTGSKLPKLIQAEILKCAS